VIARGALLALAAIAVAGCDALPRDPEHTLANIEARGAIRVGAHDLPPEAMNLLHNLETATGASVVVSDGATEPMLRRLDAGELDLVIAPFVKDTPSMTLAALSPAIRSDGDPDDPIEWRAAMRGGENRWIMLVEHQVRQVANEAGTR